MLVFYLFYISNTTKIKNLTLLFSGKRGFLLINFFFCKGFSLEKKFQKNFFFWVCPPPFLNYVKLCKIMYIIYAFLCIFMHFYAKLCIFMHFSPSKIPPKIMQNYVKLCIFIKNKYI